MAAWVSSRAAWKVITRRWRAILKGPPRVREAKAADMEAKQGDFVGWTDRQVEELRLKLCAQLDPRVDFGIAISVRRPDFERIVVPNLPRPHEHAFGMLRDPYAWVMAATVGLVVDHLKSGQRVAFTFDRGHRRQGDAERLFYWILDTDPRVGQRVVRSWQTADSVEFPPLQAADQLVWGCNRGTRIDLAQGRPFIEMRGVLGLNRAQVYGGTYDAAALTKTLANISPGGKPWGPYWKDRRRRSAKS